VAVHSRNRFARRTTNRNRSKVVAARRTPDDALDGLRRTESVECRTLRRMVSGVVPSRQRCSELKAALDRRNYRAPASCFWSST
jgi:hypothetical protein